jgi:hypothetical protein
MNLIEILLLSALIIAGWEITKRVYILKFKDRINKYVKYIKNLSK